jgi:hypothetical protein
MFNRNKNKDRGNQGKDRENEGHGGNHPHPTPTPVPNPPSCPTPVDPFFDNLHHPREDRAKAETHKKLVELLDTTYTEMKIAYEKGMKLIKDNPELSPKLVIDCLDEDAFEIVRLLMLLKDAVNVAAPGTIPDDGNPYCGSD